MKPKSVTGLLAALAAVLTVAVAVVVAVVTTDDEDAVTAAPVETTVVVTTASPSSTTITAVPPAAPPQAPPAPVGSAVVLGGVCFESEIRSFGTTGDGQSVVCASMGAAAPPRWVTHADNDGSVHSIGDPCDETVESVAQDPSGRAILCSNGRWLAGP